MEKDVWAVVFTFRLNMQEFEIKIFEIDKDQVIRTLEDQWAVFLSDDILQAYFFINDNGQKLRLRKVGDTNILTYKEKISNENVMHNLEYEVEVSDFDTMVNLLTNIGFKKYGESTKQRIAYKLDNIIYDFDKFEGIPRFVEIEADNAHDIEVWVKSIWYTLADGKNLTERQVKEYYWVA